MRHTYVLLRIGKRTRANTDEPREQPGRSVEPEPKDRVRHKAAEARKIGLWRFRCREPEAQAGLHDEEGRSHRQNAERDCWPKRRLAGHSRPHAASSTPAKSTPIA